MENNIPKTAGDSVAHFYSTGTMMIQMISLEITEEGNPGLAEMQEIVEPLFPDIALNDTRKQGRESINRKEEAEGRGHCEERQDILQFTADVPAVKRPFMVLPMKRVKALMKKAANQALTWRKAPVEDVTMKEIFHEAPHGDACQIKSHPDPRMPAAQAKQSHDQRVSCVESRQGIEPSPRNAGLFAFVGRERTLDRTIAG